MKTLIESPALVLIKAFGLKQAAFLTVLCNLAGYGFMQTEEGLYFGTIQQTRMRYQLDHEVAR